MSKITIKNTTIGSVTITVPEIRVNRTIKQDGYITMDKDLFEEALTYPGVSELISEGDIAIVEEGARLELGLQNEGEAFSEEMLMDSAEIKKTLMNGTPFQVKKMIADASDSRKNTIVKMAIDCDEISLEKVEILSKATGVDVLAAIKSKKEIEA